MLVHQIHRAAFERHVGDRLEKSADVLKAKLFKWEVFAKEISPFQSLFLPGVSLKSSNPDLTNCPVILKGLIFYISCHGDESRWFLYSISMSAIRDFITGEFPFIPVSMSTSLPAFTLCCSWVRSSLRTWLLSQSRSLSNQAHVQVTWQAGIERLSLALLFSNRC